VLSVKTVALTVLPHSVNILISGGDLTKAKVAGLAQTLLAPHIVPNIIMGS